MSAFLRLAFAVSVSLPLAAQAPLVVKTSNEDVVEGLLRSLGSQASLPELDEGAVWRVSLDDGGAPGVETVQGQVGFLELEARPGELMAIFGAQISQAQGMAQGMGAMALTKAGFKTAEAVKLIQGVFAFPKQIALARVVVDGDPDDPGAGWNVAVTLTPVADTWLADLMDAMVPTGTGVPALGGENAVMTARYDADLAALADSFDVFNELLASMGAGSKAVVEKRLPLMRKYWKSVGAGGAMSFAPKGAGMTFIASLSDPDLARAMYADSDYLGWIGDMQEIAPGMEAEIVPGAFEHRGVSVNKLVVTADDDRAAAQNPMMVDGQAVTYTAVAGNYLVGTTGRSESDAVALIDRILDDELETEKLPPNTVAILTMNIGEFMAGMPGMHGDAEMPESVRIDLRNFGGKLDIAIAVR